MKNFILVFLFVATDIFALDAQFAKIVNTTIADLKTKTTLSSLKGHVAVNVSSGNSDLDKQFAAAILETFPNFTSASGEVFSEDLYQMAVRVFKNSDNTVSVAVTVTNHRDEKTVDTRVPIGTVDNKLLTTIQYENVLRARNEFDAYLDSVFADVGPPQDANYTPKEPYDWSWLTNFFARFSFSNIAAGFKITGWEAYLVGLDYSFTNNWIGGDAISAGLNFENDIGISTALYRGGFFLSDDSGTICYFPIDISWNFLKFNGFRLAAYDRIELMMGEGFAQNNYIGLRLRRFIGIVEAWGGMVGIVLGAFTETDFKTFSLGISVGLGGEFYKR
jgi:hypothetical protein